MKGREELEALARRIVLALDESLIVCLEDRIGEEMCRAFEDRAEMNRRYEEIRGTTPMHVGEEIMLARVTWLTDFLGTEFGTRAGPRNVAREKTPKSHGSLGNYGFWESPGIARSPRQS